MQLASTSTHAVARPELPPLPEGAPAIPPAEDWIRTALLRGDFIADQPPTKDVLVMAGKTSLRDSRDVRAQLTDFRALAKGAPDSPQAFADALRAAQQMSHTVNEWNTWIRDPLVAVLRGRDRFLWGVVVRQGDGSEPIASDSSRVPVLETTSISQWRPTAWAEDVVAVVSDDHFIDLRLDVNGNPVGDGSLEPIPAAAPPAIAR
ncbi:MAG: hypothetical protein KDC46_00695 [Thermoleophilia bacterium]|nr:hypothetical protein [Thermoleophilia bacterium]